VRQADQAGEDFAAIADDLDFIRSNSRTCRKSGAVRHLRNSGISEGPGLCAQPRPRQARQYFGAEIWQLVDVVDE
jgi:hypothetical protein